MGSYTPGIRIKLDAALVDEKSPLVTCLLHKDETGNAETIPDPMVKSGENFAPAVLDGAYIAKKTLDIAIEKVTNRLTDVEKRRK